VEAVRAHKGTQNQPSSLRYLIKWQGFPEEQNSWKPASNILDQNVLRNFWTGVATQHKASRRDPTRARVDKRSANAPLSSKGGKRQ